MTSNHNTTALMTEVMDFLTQLQTMLDCANIDEQISIEQATETVYGPNEGDNYTKLAATTTGLRDRVYDHLEN